MTSDAGRDAIDKALEEWRQGDCVVQEQWFIHRFDLTAPLTEAAAEVAHEGVDIAETPEAGFVLLSQTCDIIRLWRDRPFVEVAPLVEVDEQILKEIARGYRPRYGFIPGVADRNLVADLDRVMTVEKSVVASWPRVPGCNTDEEATRFAQALSRYWARFAFPDDFATFVSKLRERLTEKHDRKSPEGEALRSLREIRVAAAPSWADEQIELTFLFIRNEDEHDFEGKSWDEFLAKWLALVPANGRYGSVSGLVIPLRDMTAQEYVASAQLDLDHVTSRSA